MSETSHSGETARQAEGLRRPVPYVVIQYEASFENKQAAVETVAPVGRWRVAGYFIR